MTKAGPFGARSAAISAGLTVRMVGNPEPLAITTKASPTRDYAELLLGGLEGLRVGEPLTLPNQPRRSGMYLKLGDRYGTTGEGGFEECAGGWNATARRT